MEFKKQKITDITSFFGDGNWIESKDQSVGGFWLVQTGNVGVMSFKEKNFKRFVSEETFKRLNCTEIFPGDILVSRLPDPVGRSCIVPKSEYKMLTAVDCSILRLKKDYEPRYINYVINSEQTKTQVYKKVTGSSRKRISRKNLGTIELPIPFKNGKPDLAEQKRIADRLDKTFAEIEVGLFKDKKNLKYSHRLFTAVLREAFNSLDLNTIRLDDISNTTSGGTPLRSNIDFYDGSISWLKSGELNDNTSITKSEEHISDIAIQKSNAKVFKVGTVLMAMYGATVGKLGILGAEASTNQAICAITPNNNVQNKYIFWFLYYYRNELVRQAFGGAQPNISQTLIRKIPVKIPTIKNGEPDIKKQKGIVDRLDKAFDMTKGLDELIEKQNRHFTALRSSVLNKAFQLTT